MNRNSWLIGFLCLVISLLIVFLILASTVWHCSEKKQVKFSKFSETNYRVAVMLIGETRDYIKCEKSLLEFLLRPLHDQNCIVDIYFYGDSQTLDKLNTTHNVIHIPTNPKFDKLSDKIHPQMSKTKIAYTFIDKYSKIHNTTYDWIVKTRPDLFYFPNAVPEITLWKQHMVMSRMRCFGTELSTPTMSWWPQDFSEEMIMDDQFFIVPYYLCDFVFSDTLGRSQVHFKYWGLDMPEAQLTQQVLSYNVQIFPTECQVRLYRQKNLMRNK
jgi:hypothetical protein